MLGFAARQLAARPTPLLTRAPLRGAPVSIKAPQQPLLLSRALAGGRQVDVVQKGLTASKRKVFSVQEGTKPQSVLKSYKATNPALRHRVTVDRSHIWPGRPVKSLTRRIAGIQQSGRNTSGRIVVRGRKKRKHRKFYRVIDFHRFREDPAIVQRFEYDPNRSPYIALIKYISDGELSYIIAPHDLAVGATVQSGDDAPYAPGNCMRMAIIPDGAEIHNIEMRPGMGGQLVRSAGMAARLMSKDEKYATLKLPSGEIRKVLAEGKAVLGQVSNENWHNRVLGKAGASNWVGRRPKVRMRIAFAHRLRTSPSHIASAPSPPRLLLGTQLRARASSPRKRTLTPA